MSSRRGEIYSLNATEPDIPSLHTNFVEGTEFAAYATNTLIYEPDRLAVDLGHSFTESSALRRLPAPVTLTPQAQAGSSLRLQASLPMGRAPLHAPAPSLPSSSRALRPGVLPSGRTPSLPVTSASGPVASTTGSLQASEGDAAKRHCLQFLKERLGVAREITAVNTPMVIESEDLAEALYSSLPAQEPRGSENGQFERLRLAEDRVPWVQPPMVIDVPKNIKWKTFVEAEDWETGEGQPRMEEKGA
ncbi:hypothetical protein C8J57DRAFT_1530253 [Mycena rebaudengoi]|nr:hypothetical protein C8J57DRAFT_1530253 [Mycena rebaudengoi]